MQREAETVLAAPDGIATDDVRRAWQYAAALAAAAGIWLIAWYGQTAASIVAIWDRSETFAHGFLVLPVFGYLLWIRRHMVLVLRPEPSWAGLLLVAGLGFGWLLAYLGQVQVVQQFSLALMIPGVVISVLGWRVARALAFPLAFLLLGVPFGEAFIPRMMDFTADFTVAMLQLTGIPVFREGTFFQIPSGSWSVVEGCSGLRYLIASIFAGTLYAYLTYTSLVKRAVFIGLSVVVPIIANGFRAYMIVMIAHLSDMKLALGIDHFIYGWVFFGLVVTLMFWIGSYWRDPDPEPPQQADQAWSRPAPLKALGGAALAAALVASIWPAYAGYLDRARPLGQQSALVVPADAGGWQRSDASMTAWQPRYVGADAALFHTYRKGEDVVALYIGYYRQQRQDAELINSQNLMVVQKHPVWQNIGEQPRSERIGAAEVEIRETRLRSPEQRLLIWDWFVVSGRLTTSAPLAKLLLARDRLLQERDDGIAVIIATPTATNDPRAAEVLRAFLRDMLPSIDATLAQAERS